MANPYDLNGKVIAITGASSGFGHHFAGVLAAAGATVLLGARREEKLAQRVREIEDAGGKALACRLDVLDKSSIEEFIDRAFETFGRLDVLINNAGVEAGAKTYSMIDESEWDFVIDTNLKSAWMTSKYHHRHPHDQRPVPLCGLQRRTDADDRSHGARSGSLQHQSKRPRPGLYSHGRQSYFTGKRTSPGVR